MPLSDIRSLFDSLPGPDDSAASLVESRDVNLTKPLGSLGRLEELSVWVSRWSGRPPCVDRALVAVFAGTHGVTHRGVSPYPSEVTSQMVMNFRSGGAAINQICRSLGLNLKVFELGLSSPTGDIMVEPAMSSRDCASAIAYGMEAISETDLLCIGEMGIGNTTIASSIYLALFGGEACDWVGPGTGLDSSGIARKIEVVSAAVDFHRSSLDDPLEVLRCLGGREIAAMFGAILAARIERVPVIIDGFVSCSAASVMHAIDSSSLDHCLFGHVSAEPAHRLALERMNKRALLDLDMRLGEGTGAALAAGIVRSAVACHTGMSTFAEASVSTRD